MSIIVCNSEGEAVSGAWDEFVSISPAATVSHLYRWRRVVSETYGHKSFYLIARREGELAGILPLVHVKSRLFGNVLSSMPFLDTGGIAAIDVEVARCLLDRALLLKKECGAESMELRYQDVPPVNEGKERRDKVSLTLDISSGPETLWKSFSAKVRNQVRKAQKSGLSTRSGGAELLEEFYRPFAINMRDLGSPVHHPSFFKNIFSVFGDQAWVSLVCEGSQTVGGLIALSYKNTAIVPWASCFRRYFQKCPNNMLYWDAMQYAYSRGCTSFDFGRSTIGSGTYNFKVQWGAQPVRLHWQVFSENGARPATESSALRMASAIWKHFPIPVANSLGPCLRKYLTN